MHALIVAGPSGAGKSAFLRELGAGRLGSDVQSHLPPGAETWPIAQCDRPKEWEPLLDGPTGDDNIAGLAAHYDITTSWRILKQELANDPFWRVLHRCEAVTLVVIRPSHRRLLDQWSHAHLGTRGPWRIRWRRLLAASSARLLAAIRRLRIAKHPRISGRTRYARPIRFLKHLDRALQSWRMRSTGTFDLYRRRAHLDRMLRSWDEVIAAKTAALPVTYIELVPDPAAEIGRTFGWRVKTLRPMVKPFPA